jgi:hypothetical protein
MLARLISTGALTDVSEGGVLPTLLMGIAEELAGFERQLADFVESHYINEIDGLVDDRVAQIPGLPPRRANLPASGGGFEVFRNDVSEAVTFQPGELQFGRSDVPGVFYVNRDLVTFAVSQVSQTIFVVCTTPGALGNAPTGVVNQVNTLSGGIAACNNSLPIAGGLDRESTTSLVRRARAWLAALARCQADALTGLALNFVDSNGTTIRHAFAVEYADAQRGYTELVVDDGFGMPGAASPAQATTGTLPALVAGTRHTFYFDHPAATPLRLSVGNLTFTEETQQNSPWWVPLAEKGVAFSQRAETFLTVGATWTIQGHLVYRGWIAEFQRYVNQFAAAAGTRVRVIAPQRQVISLSANCVVATGFAVPDVFARVREAVVQFFIDLPPGQPAFIHRLHAQVSRVRGVANIIFDQTDRYPGSPTSKLTTQLSLITLR